MIVSSIVAASNNNAIGIDNELPWHLPADLKFFKETTRGHHVIMGRKSFESIGRPLPGRTNIIVTKNKSFAHSGVIVKSSIPDALAYAAEAGQFSEAGFLTVICGPGDIAQAHRANEFISREQLNGGVEMLRRLINISAQ